jgi:hypothetical protein
VEAARLTEPQRLFLVQARSDYVVFKLLRDQSELPACHPLHYLQMASELVGKAKDWEHGPNHRSHRAFAGFLRSLTSNRKAQRQLGYAGKNEAWKQVIRKSIPLAEAIEDLAPALSHDGPNPEYPWPRAHPTNAPAEHRFLLWEELRKTAGGRGFLAVLDDLFAAAEVFF